MSADPGFVAACADLRISDASTYWVLGVRDAKTAWRLTKAGVSPATMRRFHEAWVFDPDDMATLASNWVDPRTAEAFHRAGIDRVDDMVRVAAWCPEPIVGFIWVHWWTHLAAIRDPNLIVTLCRAGISPKQAYRYRVHGVHEPWAMIRRYWTLRRPRTPADTDPQVPLAVISGRTDRRR